jgi:hypothetical protein
MAGKKPNSAADNISFSTKETNPQTATKTNINEGVNYPPTGPGSE